MRTKTIEKVFDILSKNYSNAQTELQYTNQYTFLISVVLSAQATDISVNKVTKKLFTIVKNPQDMIKLGEINLKKHIKTIGLYNNKAKNVIALSEQLLENFDGDVPQNRDDLVSLPGVGRKTANVVLNVVFQQPTMAADTHIFRVSNRTGLAPGKNVDKVEEKLLKGVEKPMKVFFSKQKILGVKDKTLKNKYISKLEIEYANIEKEFENILEIFDKG